MLTAVLLSLAVSGTETTLAAPVIQDADPPVRVWLNKSRNIERRDRLRVYVRTETDGYLVVLHTDPEGRVRVLFPLDPADDHFVRGDREYEIRGRGDRHAFTVYQSAGRGAIYAAFSPDPFVFDPLMLGDHWDYTLPEWISSDDAEADLTSFVTRLAVMGRFDYDVYEYDVGYDVAYTDSYQPSLYYHDPYYRSGFNLYLGFGPFSYFGYSGYYDPYYFGYRHHYRGAYTYYDPFYYDPFYYDPFFYGYGSRFVYWSAPHRASPRGVFVAGGSRSIGSRRYAFKSNGDRWGIRPEVVRPRRRSVATTSGIATRTGPATRRSASTTTTRRATPAARTPTRRSAAVDRSTPARRIQAPTRRSADRSRGTAGESRRLAPRELSPPTRTPLIGGERDRPAEAAQPTRRANTGTPSGGRRRDGTPAERIGTPRSFPVAPVERSPTPATRSQPQNRSGTSARRTTRSGTSRGLRPAAGGSRGASPTRRSTGASRSPSATRSASPRRSTSRSARTSNRPSTTRSARPSNRQPARSARPASRPPSRSARPASRPPSRSARPASRPRSRSARPASRPQSRSARPARRSPSRRRGGKN